MPHDPKEVLSCARFLASKSSYWLPLVIVALSLELAVEIAIVLAAIMYEDVFAVGHWTTPRKGH
jgi:hypothetical protein